MVHFVLCTYIRSSERCVYGECRITANECCYFVNGYLCSQLRFQTSLTLHQFMPTRWDYTLDL
uniref:Uncharacterized protein n=1 Tax=Megaselia scalaris TaxID=36166 RepID=T1GGV2_MEGSC